MQRPLPCDFTSVPPHPLIYASLEPAHSPHRLRRIDLHRPRTKYTVGRGPLNDFVLGEEYSGQIDWTHCTLLSDEQGDVRIVDNFTTNGIWVDLRRLAPGESCILRDGDSVRFGLCALTHCNPSNYMTKSYARGTNHCYTFHSFVTKDPPGLSPSDFELRKQTRELESSKLSVLQERLRLDRQLQNIEEEQRRITLSMREVPPTKDPDTVKNAQSRYDMYAMGIRRHYPDFFPPDVRDFRPQPWLPPDVSSEDEENGALFNMYRSFGAPPNKRPPPLENNYRVFEFTRVIHHDDAPDWSHPDIVWGELQCLNLSKPLNVPPSIIFWSIVHRLPVYMHPDYRSMAGRGPYAHPHAVSEYVFSDESAAQSRIDLGLPPLENPYPLRPAKAMQVAKGRTVGKESEIAERVALLQKKGELPATPATAQSSAATTFHESGLSPKPTSTSSKRPRVSDVELPSESVTEPARNSSSSPSPSDDKHASTDSLHSSDIKSDGVIDPSTTATASRSAPPRAPKRRKTSHSPAPSPTACSTPAFTSDEPKHIPRMSPEPLTPTEEPSISAIVSEPHPIEPAHPSADSEPEDSVVAGETASEAVPDSHTTPTRTATDD
ncbi:unnamed protein product [Peniophora sp. CBMAI 1063]|nr:unnamed protein product [Peniophora sp. CBMAI 1063]